MATGLSGFVAGALAVLYLPLYGGSVWLPVTPIVGGIFVTVLYLLARAVVAYAGGAVIVGYLLAVLIPLFVPTGGNSVYPLSSGFQLLALIAGATVLPALTHAVLVYGRRLDAVAAQAR